MPKRKPCRDRPARFGIAPNQVNTLMYVEEIIHVCSLAVHE
jgi:hypothetical protein